MFEIVMGIDDLRIQLVKYCYKKIAPTLEILEAFRESQNRVISMSLIHEELYKGGGTDTLDFSAYLRKLAENLFRTYSPVSYTHLRAHETVLDLVCRLLLE